MLETATDLTLRAIAEDAHRQRSLAAWQMIAWLGRLPARLLAWHTEGAALTDGPSSSVACAA